MIVAAELRLFKNQDIHVHLNMNERNDGQALSIARPLMSKRHNGKHCPLAVRQRIVNGFTRSTAHLANFLRLIPCCRICLCAVSEDRFVSSALACFISMVPPYQKFSAALLVLRVKRVG